MLYSRRSFGKLTLASLPLASSLKAAKNDSVVDGIQFGLITYSFNRVPAVNLIQAIVDSGLGEVELMSNHCEALAGAPAAAGRGGGGYGGRGRGAGRAPLTPEQQAAQEEARKKLADWRAAATPATWKAVTKKFNDAGIDVGVICYNMNINMTDDDIEYAFKMAQGTGAKAISCSTTVAMAKRLAPFAEKHQLPVGYHCHDQTNDPNQVATLESYEAVFSYGKWNWANMDIGHYTAGGNDPVAFIAKYHDRITNLHVKDMKRKTPELTRDVYTIFGEGDTNMTGVLNLLRDGKYKFPANIEMEAPLVPQDGDPVESMKKCFAYCKGLLA